MLKMLKPLAALFSLLVAGCYEVAEPIVTRGAYAPVAGAYTCTNHINGQVVEDSLIEKKDGFIRPDYRYMSSQGIEVTFADIGNNLFLSQLRQQGQPIMVAYMESTGNKMVFLVPNGMAAGPAIDNLSRQSAVTARFLQSGRISLTGTLENVTAYLNKNDRSLLAAALTCVKK